jgi:hypothetical protein
LEPRVTMLLRASSNLAFSCVSLELHCKQVLTIEVTGEQTEDYVNCSYSDLLSV